MASALWIGLAVLASGIQWGWQSLPNGGHEYIVQVEPQLTDLQTFRKEGFFSDVPPTLRDIRQIRVVVGDEPLPNQGNIPAAPATLPAGVSAAPLIPNLAGIAANNSAKTADEPRSSRAAPISLTDSHQPAEGPSRPAPAASGAPTVAAAQTVVPQVGAKKPAEALAGTTTVSVARPWIPLVLVAGGLIISLAANAFLGWVHWGIL